MKINKLQTEEQLADDGCSVPVPEDAIEVPKLTQFSPGAG